MAGIKNIKITRKLYRFEVKRRYQLVKHYTTRQRSSADEIKDKLRSILSPQKEKTKGTASQSSMQQEKPAKTSSGLNIPLVIGAFILALLLLIGGFMFLLPTGVIQPQHIQITEKATIKNAVLTSEVLTSGDRGSTTHVGAVTIQMNTSGLSEYNITLLTYPQVLPNEVFVLNSEKKESSSYDDFITALRAALNKRNVILNEIDIKQIETLPKEAMIIIPSGVMPQEMLGVNSNIDMMQLMDKGVVIVYLGQSFKTMLKGKLAVNTPQEVLNSVPVYFDESAALVSNDNFSLSTPLYSASGKQNLQSSIVYGSVSVLTYKNGALVICPQTLDGGWKNNGTLAAQDVARIVFETPWSAADGEGKYYDFTDAKNISKTETFFTEPFSGNDRTLKIFFSGTSLVTGKTIEDYKIVYLRKKTNGDMYTIGGYEVVPTNITAKDITIYADLKESKAAIPSMFLTITDNSGREIKRESKGNMNVQAGTTIRMPVYLDSGEYIISLMDDESKLYAQSYLDVNSIEVEQVWTNSQKASEYSFQFTMGGKQTQVSELIVEVDNGAFGTYKFYDVSTVTIDVGSYTGGDQLPYGNHTFKFKVGTWEGTYQFYRASAQFPIEIVGVSIVAILIIGVGILFARKESISYLIDIPDFPAISRTKVPLPSETVLGIFEKVNNTYKWEYTPLTVTEIKNGFKEIFYRGKSVFISDYNSEYLMVELQKKKMVKECMGYYAPANWEEKAGRSATYLAMLRRLRDICVNSAVPFTSLAESKVADSEVTVVGQQMFIHFYDKKTEPQNIIKQALASLNKGITVLLFQDEEDKRGFETLLHSTDPASLIIKMETEGSSVQLQTFEELEKMLQDLKNI
jgi:hypothetical protein